MNAAFDPTPSNQHPLAVPVFLPPHLPQSDLTGKQRISSWLEQQSDATERHLLQTSIATLIQQMISSGETESSAEQVLNRCIECGLSASGVKQLERIPEVATTLGCTISQALELLPTFLPKRDISKIDAINQHTVDMVYQLRGAPDLLTWSLNLVSDLALRGVSEQLFAYASNLISTMHRETQLGTFPENSISKARDVIADWCQTLSRLGKETQIQIVTVLNLALTDQQSIPEFFDTVQALAKRLIHIDTNGIENYWHGLIGLFDYRTANQTVPPVLAHLMRWSIEVISQQFQSPAQRLDPATWDNQQLTSGLFWIAKAHQGARSEHLACEYLPVTGDYYQAESISYYEERLLSALTPIREPWIARPPLSDESRAMIFKTLHRILRTSPTEENIQSLIAFARSATDECYDSSKITSFCQAQHRSTFRYYAPMLDDFLVEHAKGSPDDLWAIEETKDIFLGVLSVHGKMSPAATQAFSEIIAHNTTLGGSAFETIRSIALSDLTDRLNVAEPWSQVPFVLKHLLPAHLPFFGWNTHYLSESALWTPPQWRNMIRILSVCERQTREHSLDQDSHWQLNHLGLSTAHELFSFQAPPHAFRAFERLLMRDNLSLNKRERIAKRELISYSTALKRLELSTDSARSSETDLARVLEAIKKAEHQYIRNDGFPVHDYNRTQAEEKLASQMHRETMRTFQLTYGISHGFPAQRFSCQRVLTEPAQSAQFVEECGGKWKALQPVAPDIFPGSGYIFSGIDPDYLTSPAADQRGHRRLQRQHFPYLSAPLNNFSETQFIFLRGAIIVIPPAHSATQIGGTPYSLLIYNDHFSTSALEPGHLIPTEVVLSDLNDLQKASDQRAFAQQFKYFEIDHLNLQATRRGLNCLNLCWGSNLNTGLQNSFPPNSAPFFIWEDSHSQMMVDSYKHVHKQVQLEKLNRNDRIKFLEGLQSAHHQVYQTFSQCYGYLQAFQVLQAAWNRGFNSGIKVPEYQEYLDGKLLEAAQLPSDWAPSLSEPPLRQLRMAIQYHIAYQSGWMESEIPVLASCDAEFYVTGEVQPLMNPVTMEIFPKNHQRSVSIKELPLDKMLTIWSELTDQVSDAERHRRRFQDLRWVQSSYLDRSDV